MRKLVLIILIFSSARLFAQEPPNPPMPIKPLTVIDGIYYSDDLDFIKPNDIKKIEILNSSTATVIYGRQGANGAILIKTKNGKSIKTGLKPLIAYPDHFKYSSILYLNDGKKQKGLDSLNTDDVIDYKFFEKRFTSNVVHQLPILIIITRDYAIETYLNKLCSVTQGYRKYLNDHNFDDSKVLYDIDGEFTKHSDALIKFLYNLPVKKIKNTSFTEDYVMKSQSSTIFSITTK